MVPYISSSLCTCTDCRTPPSITVTPPTNQTVPINTDISVTYRCQVTDGRRAYWTFIGVPISIGSDDHALLGSLGVNISAGASQSDIYLTVDRNGRETYSNRDLRIACTELITTPVLMIQTSCDYFIRTFGMGMCVFVMPQCACASEVYGSVFVRLCLCV